MRFVDLKKYQQVIRSFIFYRGFFIGFVVALFLWFYALMTFSLDTFFIGIIAFVFVSLLVIVLSLNIERAVHKKRLKTPYECMYLDVKYEGENGVLCILEDKIVYHSLGLSGKIDDFEIEITRELLFTTGVMEQNKVSKILKKGIKEVYIVIKDLSLDDDFMFLFLDIDQAHEKIKKRIDNVMDYKGD